MTKVAIFGGAGRMGLRLAALTLDDPELELAASLEAPGHPSLGQDAGQIAGAQPAGLLSLPTRNWKSSVPSVTPSSGRPWTSIMIPLMPPA